MLSVLNRIVSIRWFFVHPKHIFQLMGKKIRAGPRGVVYGGKTSSQRLEPSGASREQGESMREGGGGGSLEGCTRGSQGNF